MKILLVNHRYFGSGGPERYLFGVTELLEDAGHEVVPFSIRYARNKPTPWSRYFVEPIAGDDEALFEQHTWTPRSFVRALRRTIYDGEVYRGLSALIAESHPDVAYLLKYRRKLSPAILAALADAGVPIVVRLSDYGMVCPEEHMLRGDDLCDECVRGSIWPSVRYRCVHGSLGPSAVNYAATMWHRSRGYFDLVDTFVAPSRFLHDQLVRGGVDPQRVVSIPTFVVSGTERATRERDAIAYVGRMQRKKGADLLVDAFGLLKHDGAFPDVRLLLAGDEGTEESRRLEADIARRGISDVELVGFVSHEAVMEMLDRSIFSVIPSLCYDNLPNALLESWVCAAPVVATDVGSLTETVSGTGAGLLFERGSAVDLAEKMRTLLGDPAEARRMGERGRDVIATRYGPADHLNAVMGVLEGAVTRGDRSTRRTRRRSSPARP